MAQLSVWLARYNPVLARLARARECSCFVWREGETQRYRAARLVVTASGISCIQHQS